MFLVVGTLLVFIIVVLFLLFGIGLIMVGLMVNMQIIFEIGLIPIRPLRI